MFDFKNINKEKLVKLITVLVIGAIIFLSISILSDDNDNRRLISSTDGETEETLCNILSEIKGVGKTDAMIQRNNDNEVVGVIVTIDGADDPIVKNNVVKGVSALFNISPSYVMVFERERENGNEKE